MAARAGQSARTGAALIAAVALRSTGFSINALLRLAHARRQARQADAVLAAHTGALTAAGPYQSVTVLLPARTNPHLKRFAARTGATTVVTSAPIHPPGEHVTPATNPRHSPPHTG
ncbi:hypothetical protein [Streptomyces sp. TRM70350]|uniref:hypothetical protein n=1 Tax=Streptomyces sp. TRM70350 TaxID=2856165 RepID=UPI001C491A1D|nr:hypothetical protein [Streptomyces sp. TRM70350]MBV7699812.1 hypothetical protein [Streptomyces sp. TRM70350]